MKIIRSKYRNTIVNINGVIVYFRNYEAIVEDSIAFILSSKSGYSLSTSDGYLNAKSILIARNMGIGDVLFVSTVSAFIKKVNPKCKLTFATFPQYFRVLKNHPYIDGVEDIGKVSNDTNFLNKYEWAMNFNNYFESGKMLAQGNTLHRVDMLQKFFNASDTDWDCNIYYTILEEEKTFATQCLQKFKNKKIIGFVPHATEATRSHPNWVNIIKFLVNNGYAIVILSSSNGITFDHPDIINMSGKTNIGQLSAILDKVDLVITPDTGSLHIAGALGKKIITFFNSFPPKTRIKYYENCFAFSAKGKCPQNLYPCGYSHCPAPCLKSITSEMILIKVKEMLGG